MCAYSAVSIIILLLNISMSVYTYVAYIYMCVFSNTHPIYVPYYNKLLNEIYELFFKNKVDIIIEIS